MNDTLAPVRLPALLKLLAHDIRWNLLALLARSDYNGQEMMRLLKQPQNLLSYHLRQLHTHGLITERRSSADGRDIYYSLNLDLLHASYIAAAASLHPALGQGDTPRSVPHEMTTPLPEKPIRLLFLCTENSARSQMAEGIVRHLSHGRIEVASAGSYPSSLHPLAVRVMADMGIDISQQRPKHIHDLPDHSFAYVVTVCDRVRESCPTLPGDPERIHWSFPDPATVEGSEEDRYRAFEQTALQLMTRIRYLLILMEREQDKEH